MNIKDIINKERWELLPHHLTRVKQHNVALDRIEAAVLKRIAELEEQVEAAYKRGYDAGFTNGFQ